VSTPTATASAAASPTVTAPVPNDCVGDCDASNGVGINELVTGVNIALGAADVSRCPSFDRDDSGDVEIAELVAAVNASLSGCA
jgi:hypothetical protein